MNDISNMFNMDQSSSLGHEDYDGFLEIHLNHKGYSFTFYIKHENFNLLNSIPSFQTIRSFRRVGETFKNGAL